MESREPVSVDEEVAALSRGADRDSLFMQASLILPGRPESVTVRVRNLSPGGMLAEAMVQVAQGGAVEVDLRNVGRVSGRIVWAGEGKFGIAFDRPVAVRWFRSPICRRIFGVRGSRRAPSIAGADASLSRAASAGR